MGGVLCDWTKSNEQDRTCPIFNKWKKKKEIAYNIKLPLSLDENIASGAMSTIRIDYAKSSIKLHNLVIKRLSERHKAIYIMLYVEHKDEQDVAERFGFKGDSTKRKTIRYKQISNLKKKFYKIAIKIMQENDIL
tara:strand:- start:319 stop:723 length:405 start_codon:yes stop_codon:yes gene_type:complete